MQTGRPAKRMDSILDQNVCQTLLITCQICLNRVKDPKVCSNMHVFCTYCISIWLQKNSRCPSCRVCINMRNLFKLILGGSDDSDKEDLLKPTDFSHSTMRKARYLNLFSKYENEIARLNLDTFKFKV